MPTQKFNPAILLAAIEGFEQQKLRIDAQIAELRAMLPGEPVVTPEAPTAKRRRMSAAARKRMSEAQRKRWAASSAAPVTPEPSKPKRTLSAAGKAAIVVEETLGREEGGSGKGSADRCQKEHCKESCSGE